MTTTPPSDGNERGSKMIASKDKSDTRLTLQVDNTSALPIFLQGRTVAILGGQIDRHTIDAKEPIQRQQIRDQLEQAHSLRSLLEEAASKVEALSSSSSTSKASLHEQAMNILRSSLPHMNQLENWIDACEGGNYISSNLGNNVETERKKQRRDEKSEKERQRERQIIRKHLREFARESNPKAKIDDEEMEEIDSLEGASRYFLQDQKLEVTPAAYSGRAALPTPTTAMNKPKCEKGIW